MKGGTEEFAVMALVAFCAKKSGRGVAHQGSHR